MEGRWWGPNSIGEDSLIVAARYEEDVSWMATHLQGIMPFVVYNTKDSSATHYTSVHNGNEAAAYLQFIVDYYDCLPAYIAFIHAHRRDMKVAPDFDMLGPLPDELYVNGGGQFLVRRERVLAHSRQFYQDCLTWLDESLDLSPWDKGMVFEYTWKSIFGEAAAVLDLNIWS
ncbi:MAG: hypothetical protein FRX49_05263 [Trebouxia sp. A1-2]|nr:MAG: hypothetical protein FRX49_05263 [Trebouxia sp. A1-2]